MKSFHSVEDYEEALIIQKPVFTVRKEKNLVAKRILQLY